MRKTRALFIPLCFVLASFLMLGLVACGNSSSDDATEQEEQGHVSLVAAYHPLTGWFNASELSSDQNEVAKGIENAKEGESSNDTKVMFMMVRVDPDDSKNLEWPLNCQATLTVDGENKYYDNYGLNKGQYEGLRVG